MKFRDTMDTVNDTMANTVHPNTFSIAGVYMIIVTLGSVSFNGLASYILLVKFHISNPQVKILFSLYVGDTLAPALSYPLVIYANFKQHWDLGGYTCSYYSFITSVGGISSIFHLVLLSGERFIAIVHPFDYKEIISTRNINIALLVSWLVPIAISSLPLFGWSSFVIEGIGTACAFDLFPVTWSDKSFNIFLICIAFALPMTFILYFNVSFLGVVFRLVRCPCDKRAPCGRNVRHNSLCQVGQDRRLAKQMSVLVSLLIFCFFCSWSPYAVIAILGILGRLPQDNLIAISIPSFLAKSYSLYDPIVYFFLDKRFRNAVVLMFCKRKDVIGGNGLDVYPRMHPTIKNETESCQRCETKQNHESKIPQAVVCHILTQKQHKKYDEISHDELPLNIILAGKDDEDLKQVTSF